MGAYRGLGACPVDVKRPSTSQSLIWLFVSTRACGITALLESNGNQLFFSTRLLKIDIFLSWPQSCALRLSSRQKSLGDNRYNKSEHFYLLFKPEDYVLVAQYTAAVRFESLPKREGRLSQRYFYDKSVNGNKDGFLHQRY